MVREGPAGPRGPRVRRAPLVIAALLTAPALFVGVGLFFHTTVAPRILGKYSAGYVLFLCFWWFLLTPSLFLFFRFLCVSSSLKRSGGRSIEVRPAAKILAVLILGVALGGAARHRIERKLGGGVATPQQSDVFHPYLQNTPRAGHEALGINRWGFRGQDIEQTKPAGTTRVFAFGGSTVFSGALPLAQTWPELLRQRLSAALPDTRVEMQNASAEWHCSQHSLIKLLTWVQDFDPDLIIIYHGINDLYRGFVSDSFATGAYRPDYGHFHGAVSVMSQPGKARRHFMRMLGGVLFSDIRSERVRVFGPDGNGLHGIKQFFFTPARRIEVREWRSLPAFERNMRDFLRIARQKGIHVVVASQPFLYREDLSLLERERIWFPLAYQQDGTCPTISSMADGMSRFNAMSRTVAEDGEVLFVDLEKDVPKTTAYMYDDVHYTANACERIAELLGDAIVQSGLLSIPATSAVAGVGAPGYRGHLDGNRL